MNTSTSSKRKRIPNSLYSNAMFVTNDQDVDTDCYMDTKPSKEELAKIQAEIAVLCRPEAPEPTQKPTTPRSSPADGQTTASTEVVQTTRKRGRPRKTSLPQPLPPGQVGTLAYEINRALHELPSVTLPEETTPSSTPISLPIVHKVTSIPQVHEQLDVKPHIVRTIDLDCFLKDGMLFQSFAEFRTQFDAWQSGSGYTFRVASSETLKDIDGTVHPVFNYKYVVYQCVHFGEPRKRGQGKRPNQNYLPCGCKAMFRLNYSFVDRALKATTVLMEHNHIKTASSELGGKVRRKTLPSNLLRPDHVQPNVMESDKVVNERWYAEQQQKIISSFINVPDFRLPLWTDFSHQGRNMISALNDNILRPMTSMPAQSLFGEGNSAFCRVPTARSSPSSSEENSLDCDLSVNVLKPVEVWQTMQKMDDEPRELTNLTVL